MSELIGGPWKFDDDGVVCDNTGKPIMRGDLTEDEFRARGKLICIAPKLLAVCEMALHLSGGWREAIVELEDWCSEPVRLRNMLAAADQLAQWRIQALDIIVKAGVSDE